MQYDWIYKNNDCELTIYIGNNLEIIGELPHAFRLIYMDPPFNTGGKQSRKSIKVTPSSEGDRKGFKDKIYSSQIISNMSYEDKFDSLSEFLYPRIERMYNILTDDGSILVHLDYREVHDVKVLVMDKIFGRKSFTNEIIWAYDYGARSREKWSTKHDTILWYVKDPNNYIFNYEEIDRVPYMAPGLVSKEKVERGKTITDVWWHTIVCGEEKTGYPTQKPRAILDRFIKMNSLPGDYVMDPFAGSGTFGEAALSQGRSCVLVDDNPEAINVIEKRLKRWHPEILS